MRSAMSRGPACSARVIVALSGRVTTTSRRTDRPCRRTDSEHAAEACVSLAEQVRHGIATTMRREEADCKDGIDPSVDDHGKHCEWRRSIRSGMQQIALLHEAARRDLRPERVSSSSIANSIYAAGTRGKQSCPPKCPTRHSCGPEDYHNRLTLGAENICLSVLRLRLIELGCLTKRG
jgi:hypothetical protein